MTPYLCWVLVRKTMWSKLFDVWQVDQPREHGGCEILQQPSD